ncbi:hypothetical protein OC846_002019 [Tilletia horrida]|uniref:FAD/NAD(P)-binding domain-containing protein n=1 Tax=Tilletia horrida TaxID=155126 RepID=A0AAN6JTC2_9BASI|nr:hypothetical protein OC845_002164 [Tilletia horrida]KAK0554685.1 hypothetical protein OC846_002019 [Tilletia horrida]KAK0569811.1 hypothetical protein OC861_000522 [Tilletia horrida]
MPDLTSSETLYDVIVVGAGISGINAAYRLQDQAPHKKFLILEATDKIGGTWALFDYPGLRSDSDLATFGYAFKPWVGADIADGHLIKEYVIKVSDDAGITAKTLFKHRVTEANFSSPDREWQLTVDADGTEKHFKSQFLFLATGYYDYENPLKVDIPGIDNFKGQVVHPQFWDKTKVNYENKRVVVIGSGATAVTLIPSMADKTKSITMLQRSPTYLVSLPKYDPFSKIVRAILPGKIAYQLIRFKNLCRMYGSYHLFQAWPALGKWYLRTTAKMWLRGTVDVDPHFKPRYNPWDQRLCIVPDGDFFKVLRERKANIVTDHIAQVVEDGIELKSGQKLDADMIVTATGLKIKLCGGIHPTVDGKPIKTSEKFVWRGAMVEDVPNFMVALGYVNASWTLGSDCSALMFCRLLNYLDDNRKTYVVPKCTNRSSLKERPLLALSSTYVVNAKDALPKSADKGVWKMKSNYWVDLFQAKYGSWQGLVFK